MEQCKVAKQAKAAQALLTAPTSKGEKDSKKASAKKSLKKEKPSQKTKNSMALANASAPKLCNEYQALYNKASFAKETAKNKRKATATEMFQFYMNLLSLDAMYLWNKIVWEQTEADSFKDLHGVSRKSPRGLTRESFNNCVMFHLLTVFPNNAAEQGKHYLSNVLKKPQRVGVRQFGQRVEQLYPYIAQLPCWYYSPSYVNGMTPVNVPFTEADLASHVLWMCQYQWQDQYNLQEKGMTPMDMHSLQASILRLLSACVPPRKPLRNPARKLLTRTRQELSSPVMEP